MPIKKEFKMPRPNSICQECIFSRMGTETHKKCPHSGQKCDEFTVHLCAQCANMAQCQYIRDVKKAPSKYDFIKKHEKTTAETVAILQCTHFKNFEKRPAFNPKDRTVFQDLFEVINELDRIDEFI